MSRCCDGLLASPGMKGAHGGVAVTVTAFLCCPPHSPNKSASLKPWEPPHGKSTLSICWGLSSHILMDGDVVDRPWVSSTPQVPGSAHSSISLDFRIHKHASKHPWLCFGSFLDVLIQFRSPWQAQARSYVLITLNQPKVFGRRLEAAGQGKAGRNP